MAFSDYIDLRTAVIEEVGTADISDVFDRLTKLAEARLNRKLRSRYQITSTPMIVASGSDSLPSDFLEVVGVFDPQGRELLARPHQFTAQTYQSGQYSITGTEVLTADGTYTLQYYAALPTLTGSMTTSNWLLANYPAVYLYAVTVEALKHLRRAEDAAVVESVLRDEMGELETDDFSARYARGAVRVQGGTP
jgi:hypothetical protein